MAEIRSRMLLSILIPVRDNQQGLLRCLRGLAAQDTRDCELLICDDGSLDPLNPELLIFSGLNTRLLQGGGNGPAAARNLLAAAATGSDLLFLDSDVEPRADTLDHVRSILREDPEIGAFVGSYDAQPAHRSAVSIYRNLLHHFVHQHAAPRISTFWCGCGVIRRSLFLDLGGLSETYRFPSVEDIEFGYRLHQKGIAVRLVPELQVKHLKAWTFSGFVHTDLFRRGIPWARLMKRTHSWRSELNFDQRSRLAAVTVLVLCGSLLLTFWNSWWLAVVVTSLLLFCGVNHRFFRLIALQAGWRKALAAIPLHIVHTLICIVSFLAVFLEPAGWNSLEAGPEPEAGS